MGRSTQACWLLFCMDESGHPRMGPCLRAFQATYLAVQQIYPTTVDQDIHVKCPYAIQTFLSTGQAHPVTATRCAKWIVLLETLTLIIEDTPASNIVT